MWTAFFLQNMHFAVNIIAAMVFSWVFWLYFDVWKARHDARSALKFLGFLLLTFSFVFHSIQVESSIVGEFFFEKETQEIISVISRFLGYMLLSLGIFTEPELSHPFLRQNSTDKKKLLLISAIGVQIPLLVLGKMFLPILAAVVGLLYLYKATHVYEFHLRRVSLAFFVLALFELFSLSELFQESSNVALFKAVASFSPLWTFSHLILLIASLILGKWIFSYLLKRLQTQLYMFFSISILVIFLISTLTFTAVLLRNVQGQAVSQLETSVKVLDYALQSKENALLSDAQVFTKDENLISNILTDQKPALATLSSDFLLAKSLGSLVVVNENGQVIARGEEPERINDSLSGNPQVKRALLGESTASVVVRDSGFAPQVLLSSSVPIKDSDSTIGVALAQFLVDNAFVDGVKEATGLESAVYGNDQVSATTLVSEDGVTRRVGITESNSKITEEVLGRGEPFSGTSDVVNSPFYVAYLPLKDVDENPVGMLFVGQPQVSVLRTAGYSIQLTFVVAGILWILAILPSYLISNYISKQLR